MSAADYRDPLYRECIPTRLTPPDPYRMKAGPTAAFAELEREREKWLMFGLFEDDPDEAVA